MFSLASRNQLEVTVLIMVVTFNSNSTWIRFKKRNGLIMPQDVNKAGKVYYFSLNKIMTIENVCENKQNCETN